jgi:hypothetical protein
MLVSIGGFDLEYEVKGWGLGVSARRYGLRV